MRQHRKAASFETVAIVLLPDHLHVIWTLPRGDDDYPSRWQAIKAKFTSQWLAAGGEEHDVTRGYRRRGVWQPRFMEHAIRDEQDLHNHADYIHYNPVKHGYVQAPRDWPWSSFHRYVRSGDYPVDWGCAHERPPQFGGVDEGLIE
jgi:putative transposase